MKSRALVIYHAEKKTKSFADAIAAAASFLLVAVPNNPAVSRQDDITLRSLITALHNERSSKIIIKKMVAHLQKIENEHVYQALYVILREVEKVFHEADNCSLPKIAPMKTLPGIRADYKNEDRFGLKIATLLKAKNISLYSFQRDTTLDLTSDLSKHAAWAFHHIYSIPLGKKVDEISGKIYIERVLHGIHHATLAALYAPVVANLYRRHGDADALALTEDDLRYIQTALLLHDAAREDERADKWDHESAIITYLYLTRVCGADKKTANAIACAVANKDINENGLFEFTETENGDYIEFSFSPLKDDQTKKSIQQKIIHDADCLEVARARKAFNAARLDFYQDIVKHSDTAAALDEMAELIAEVGALHDMQGCSYNRVRPAVKVAYEQEHAHDRILLDIRRDRFPMLALLGKRLLPAAEATAITLLNTQPYQPDAGVTDENIKAATREGLVFARGVSSPSTINNKNEETLAELECRKTFRETDIATRSNKEARHKKFGNPARSVSRLGYRTRPFCSVGYLLIDPNISTIKAVSAKNIKSGRGKKAAFISEATRTTKKDELIAQELAALHVKMKMGGGILQSKKYKHYTSNHTEVICDIQKFDAIYISPDHTYFNLLIRGHEDSKHTYLPILQGIYLRDLYARMLTAKRLDYIQQFGEEAGVKKFESRFGKAVSLPIVEYTGVRHAVRVVTAEELSDQAILHYWTTMCGDYLSALEKKVVNLLTIDNMSVHDLKILAMYHGEKRLRHRRRLSTDVYYAEPLKKQLDDALSALLIEQRKRLRMLAKEKQTPDYFKQPEAIHEAVCFAMLTDNLKLVSTYLTNHPEVFDPSIKHHENLLLKAIQSGSTEMVKLILNFRKNDIIFIQESMALHYAAELGYLDVIDILIANGASANWLDHRNFTALDVAIMHGHLKIVKRLYESMKMLHYQTQDRPSPLFLAATHNQIEVAGYFCAQQIFILSATNNEGMTMLHICCQNGYNNMVQLLLDNGADRTINLTDASGKTALMHAVIKKQPEIVKKLLASGADVNLRDNFGFTAMDHLNMTSTNASGLFQPADRKKMQEIEEALMQAMQHAAELNKKL